MFFLAMNRSFFFAIIGCFSKAYFTLKQLKADYLKNQKDENHGQSFVCP